MNRLHAFNVCWWHYTINLFCHMYLTNSKQDSKFMKLYNCPMDEYNQKFT